MVSGNQHFSHYRDQFLLSQTNLMSILKQNQKQINTP